MDNSEYRITLIVEVLNMRGMCVPRITRRVVFILFIMCSIRLFCVNFITGLIFNYLGERPYFHCLRF
jgi:hypothetical protein